MTAYRRTDSYQAVQNDGTWETFTQWAEAAHGGPIEWGKDGFPDVVRTQSGKFLLETPKGAMSVDVGDWFFKTDAGTLYGIDGDAFVKAFEPVPTGENSGFVDADEETENIVRKVLYDSVEWYSAAENVVQAGIDKVLQAFKDEGIMFREAAEIIEARRQLNL